MAANNVLWTTRCRVWQTPWMQVRHATKIQTRNPREPHYDKKLLLAVCEPVYLKDRTPEWMKCKNNFLIKEDIYHPLERILAKELRKYLEDSEMICFYQVNHIIAEDYKAIKNILFKQDMFLKTYNTKTMKLALKDSPYECALKLAFRNTSILFSPKQQIAKLLSLAKKMPQFILLGGVIDNRLFHRQGLIEYSQLPPLDVLRGQLCSVLGSAAAQSYQLLSHHQTVLSRNLTQYVEQNTPSTEGTNELT